MAPSDAEELPPPQRLAVAYSPLGVRPAMLALLTFDALLARSLSSAREPLPAQLRLAWWREELAKPAGERATGNPTLDAIGAHWRGDDAELGALVDGWEHLLGEAPLSEQAIGAFAKGRGSAMAGLARIAGVASVTEIAGRAGQRWALADLAYRVSDEVERERCRKLYGSIPAPAPPLPRELRGLAVLDGLACRAMRRHEPLMAGRCAALAAMRLGMFGR